MPKYGTEHGDKITRLQTEYAHLLDETPSKIIRSKIIKADGTENYIDIDDQSFSHSFENYNGKLYMVLRGDIYYSDQTNTDTYKNPDENKGMIPAVDTERGIRKGKLLIDEDGIVSIEKIIERSQELSTTLNNAERKEAFYIGKHDTSKETPIITPAIAIKATDASTEETIDETTEEPEKLNFIAATRKKSNTEKVKILEVYKGVSLQNLLDDPNKPVSDAQWLDIIAQCFDLVTQLHEKGDLHRDINPSNFVAVYDATHQRYVVSMIDFGMTTSIASQEILGIRGHTPLMDISGVSEVAHYILEELLKQPPPSPESPESTDRAKVKLIFDEIDGLRTSGKLSPPIISPDEEPLSQKDLTGIDSAKYNVIKAIGDTLKSEINHVSPHPTSAAALFGKPLQTLPEHIQYEDKDLLRQAKDALYREVFSQYTLAQYADKEQKTGKIVESSGIKKARTLLLEPAEATENLSDFKKVIQKFMANYASGSGNNDTSLIRFILSSPTLVKVLHLKETPLNLTFKKKLGQSNYDFWTDHHANTDSSIPSNKAMQADSLAIKNYLAAPPRRPKSP